MAAFPVFHRKWWPWFVKPDLERREEFEEFAFINPCDATPSYESFWFPDDPQNKHFAYSKAIVDRGRCFLWGAIVWTAHDQACFERDGGHMWIEVEPRYLASVLILYGVRVPASLAEHVQVDPAFHPLKVENGKCFRQIGANWCLVESKLSEVELTFIDILARSPTRVPGSVLSGKGVKDPSQTRKRLDRKLPGYFVAPGSSHAGYGFVGSQPLNKK